MAITSASSRRTSSKSVNKFEGQENVINLALDKKLELQLKTKAMLDDLQADAKKSSFFKEKYNELLDAGKNNTIADLRILEKDINTQYDTIKGTGEALKISKMIDDKLKKLAAKEPIDDFAERYFDNRVINNTGKYSNIEDLETAFNNNFRDVAGPEIELYVEAYKDAEIQEVLKNYRFEIEINAGEVLNKDGLDDELRRVPGYETVINPDIVAQVQEPITYIEMSKKERKEAGFVDNYRKGNKDKNQAMQNILDELPDWMDTRIRTIDTDDFVSILDNVVFEKINIEGTTYPNFIAYVAGKSKDKYGNIDEKLFKKNFKNNFKEEFIKKGFYNNKGLPNDKRTLADIFWVYVEETENGGTNLQKEFKRLADASQEGLHYTGERNSELMLSYVDYENTFNFLCDFNSDGKIDGGRDGGDRGSIMGLQLYENFITFADTERDENNMQKIIDGPKTSALIFSILNSTKERTENKDLQKSITYFLEGGDLTYTDNNDKKQTVTLESGKENGNYTIENFFAFIKGEFNFGRQNSEVLKQLHTPETYDIKEFLINQGNQINEQRNVAEIFMDKDKIGKKTLEAVRNMPRIDRIRAQLRSGDALLNRTLDDKLTTGGDRSALSAQLENQSQVAEVKKDLSDKILTTVFAITDYIFFNLGEDNEAWANMFGKALGSISQTRFKDAESFKRNKQQVRDALGGYLISKMYINANLSVAQIGDGLSPVLGFGVGFGDIIDTQNGKSNRWGANIPASYLANIPASFLGNIRNFGQSKFMISPSVEYAIQVNETQSKRLATKKPIPVNRIGIEAGAGFDLTDFYKSAPYLGFFFEKDYVSGVRQYERKYEQEIRGVLFGKKDVTAAFDNDTKKVAIYKSKGEFIRELNKKIGDESNKSFLEDTILQLAELMEWGGTFDLLKDPSITDAEKQDIVKYVYEAFIEGFKENLIAQDKLNQLDKRVKLTKCGLRFNAFEIAKIFGAGIGGASVGSMIPGVGTVIGGILGATMASVEFTRYKNQYSKDIHKGLLNYQEIGNFRESNEKDLRLNTLQEYGTLLEKDINGRKKYLQVEDSEKNGTLTISSAQTDLLVGGSVLDHMNVYYSDDALKNGGFSYDGDHLVLGDVEFTTYKVINQDSVEVFMMIGDNLEGPLTQLTSADTGLEYQSIDKIEKEPLSSVPFTREKILSLKNEIVGTNNPDAATLSKLQTEYEAWATKVIIPEGIINGHVEVKKNVNQTFSFDLIDDGAQDRALDNKLTLTYIEERTDFTNLAESYYSVLKNIPMESQNLIEYTGNLAEAKKIIDKFDTKDLAELEKKSGNLKQEFKLFMEYVTDGDLEKAKKQLIKILQGDKEMAGIVSLLNKNDTEGHAYIVDRFLAVFAYEKKYETQGTIKNILTLRTGDTFLKLIGSDNNYKDLKKEIKDLREDVKNTGGDYDYDSGERINNLIGYTAFYRKGTEGEAHGYGLTALSDTKIFENTKRRLSDEQQKTGKERVVNKFSEKTNEKKQFTKKIKNILDAHNIDASELTNEQVISLIKGEGVYIDNRKKIVKMNVECIFYLLAECANESIGLEVKGIEVKEYNPEKDPTGRSYGGEVLADREDEAYIPKWNYGILNSDYDISTRASKFGAKGMLGHEAYEETDTDDTELEIEEPEDDSKPEIELPG